MTNVHRVASALCVFLVGMAAPSNASPVIFTDRSAFVAAADPNHNFTFDADFTDCTFVDVGTCVHTFDGLLRLVYDFAGIGLLGDSIGLGPWNGQASGASFVDPVIALGFELVAIQTPPKSIVNPDGSTTFDSTPQPAEFHFAGSTFGIPAGGIGLPLFFGAIFDDPMQFIWAFATVDYATAHGGSVGFAVKNMTVRTVPEPSTLSLAAAGILVVAARRRYLHRARARHS